MGWFFGSSHRYEQLPTSDPILDPAAPKNKVFSFDSIFEFKTVGTGRNFKSIYKFDKYKDPLESDYHKFVEKQDKESSFCKLDLLSIILTSLSYLLFLFGFPISYWFCVHKVGEHDRLVLFRLGRMTGVKGPGRVIVFPWIDTAKRVNISACAFSVPPQQFITSDGGIVEMGAEVQYTIVDIVTMVKEVVDHQDILRSLSKTLLTRVLTKKTVSQLTKDRRIAAQQILTLLNDQVRKWGIDSRLITLSDPKVMRKPENNKSALGPILQNLGLKQEKQFPSPQQFVRTEFGGEHDEGEDSDAEALNSLASAVGGFITGQGPSLNLSNMNLPPGMIPGASNAQPSSSFMYTAAQDSSAGQGSSKSGGNGMDLFKTQVLRPRDKSNDTPFWKSYLDKVIVQDGVILEQEAMGVYQILIQETESGNDECYTVEITPTGNRVRFTKDTGFGPVDPDVKVSISSCDLLSVLQGNLSPLQAYLTGRISATGDVKKLMFFDKISSRGHKHGSMFSI